MVAIDYAAYPHIIDLIWSYLDLKTLLVLRPLCSTWRTKLNKILQRHMVLELGKKDKKLRLELVIKQSEDPLALTFHWMPGNVLPKLPRYFLYNEHLDEETANNLRVLDINFCGGIYTEGLGHKLYWLSPETPIRAKLPMVGERLFQIYCFGSTQVYFLSIADRLELYFNEPPEKLVLNLDCVGPEASPILESTIMRPVDSRETVGSEITIVFDHGGYILKELLPMHVENLSNCLAYEIKSAMVTLVGIERLFKHKIIYEQFKAHFYAEALEVFNGKVPYDPVVRAPDHGEALCAEQEVLDRFAAALKDKELRKSGAVRLLTCEEYENEVGHEKYMIHTAGEPDPSDALA